MSLGLVGRKRGMTRIFTEDGVSTPVTVVEVVPNRVTRVKTAASDGYSAVQVTLGEKRPSGVPRPQIGEYRKAGVVAGLGLWEFRVAEEEGSRLTVGAELKVDLFAPGQRVDVTGTTIGKGFAGTIKRHNFRAQDASHGNSVSHRVPGSIGQCQTPGKVMKGKRMAGHMGDKRRTVQGLEVVRVDAERNLILLKGAVPGARGGDVVIRPAVKARPRHDS
jgi:large subunit ribosomal protein L3